MDGWMSGSMPACSNQHMNDAQISAFHIHILNERCLRSSCWEERVRLATGLPSAVPVPCDILSTSNSTNSSGFSTAHGQFGCGDGAIADCLDRGLVIKKKERRKERKKERKREIRMKDEINHILLMDDAVFLAMATESRLS
jgi:hypothetical protein